MPIEGKARALLGLGVAGCVCALLFAVPSWQIHAQDRDWREIPSEDHSQEEQLPVAISELSIQLVVVFVRTGKF